MKKIILVFSVCLFLSSNLYAQFVESRSMNGGGVWWNDVDQPWVQSGILMVRPDVGGVRSNVAFSHSNFPAMAVNDATFLLRTLTINGSSGQDHMLLLMGVLLV